MALGRIIGNDLRGFSNLNVSVQMARPDVPIETKVTLLVKTYAEDLARVLKLELLDCLELLKTPTVVPGCQVLRHPVLASNAVKLVFSPDNLRFRSWRVPYLLGSRVLQSVHSDIDLDVLVVAEMQTLGVTHVHHCGNTVRKLLFARPRSFRRLEYGGGEHEDEHGDDRLRGPTRRMKS